MIAADNPREIGGQRVRRQRTGRDDHGLALARVGDRGDFFTHDADERVAANRFRDDVGKLLAIDGQRRAGGHTARFGGAHDDRSKAPHFLLQETDGVIEFVAAERIAADELGEPVGLVNGSGAQRPHLVQRNGHAARRGLPRGLGAREAAAYDPDAHQTRSSPE